MKCLTLLQEFPIKTKSSSATPQDTVCIARDCLFFTPGIPQKVLHLLTKRCYTSGVCAQRTPRPFSWSHTDALASAQVLTIHAFAATSGWGYICLGKAAKKKALLVGLAY